MILRGEAVGCSFTILSICAPVDTRSSRRIWYVRTFVYLHYCLYELCSDIMDIVYVVSCEATTVALYNKRMHVQQHAFMYVLTAVCSHVCCVRIIAPSFCALAPRFLTNTIITMLIVQGRVEH